MFARFATLFALVAAASAMELNDKTFDDAIAGKSVSLLTMCTAVHHPLQLLLRHVIMVKKKRVSSADYMATFLLPGFC